MQFRTNCKDYCHSMKREKHDFGCQGWISTSTKHLLLKQSQKKQQMHRSTSQEAAKVVGASWTEALEIWTPWGNFEEGFNHRLSDTIKCRRSTYKQFMGYAHLYAKHRETRTRVKRYAHQTRQPISGVNICLAWYVARVYFTTLFLLASRNFHSVMHG